MVTMDRQHSARLGLRLESNPEEQILPRSAIFPGPGQATRHRSTSCGSIALIHIA
jgi:hypothetical protein